jgi:hypothetical protein
VRLTSHARFGGGPHGKGPESGHLAVWPTRQKHGGNIQVVCDPTGFPVWTSPVEPGSTHDITAARAHALPALYRAAAHGLPTLTDNGYTGAGLGVHVPVQGHALNPRHATC